MGVASWRTWLRNSSQYLLNADGSAAQFRDWYTISRARPGFITDTVAVLNDKLTFNPGIRYTTLGRQFTNSPNQRSTRLGFGGTGYGGAELLRRLLFHPQVEVARVTAADNVGKLLGEVHFNLAGLSALTFQQMPAAEAARGIIERCIHLSKR